MRPKEMREMLRKQPFEPFRIHLQDERTIEIKYPKMNLVTGDIFYIGVPDPIDPDPFIAERFMLVGWSAIVSVEPLISAKPL